MSSPMALRRSQPIHHHRSFVNILSASSSSITEDEFIPQNEIGGSAKRKNNKRENLSTVIQELLKSNTDLKKEIYDIRRQIKHNERTNNHHVDRSYTNINRNKIRDEHNHSIFANESNYYNDPTKLHQYKTEALVYKQHLDVCQETIVHLRKTINTMEKQITHLKTSEQRPTKLGSNQYETFSTDHRFIQELFHLCLKQSSHSSKLQPTLSSDQDMKTYIQQTFNQLIRRSTNINSNKTSEINHFNCKCSDRIDIMHRPSYQYCLDIIQQYQSLFSIKCFTQIPASLVDLRFKHEEFNDFIRSISNTCGIHNENPKILIKTLQKLIDGSNSNELIAFKELTKIKDMNEAITKIRSYDDLVPYYHQFIEQLAELLEVSKADEIMSAIKTLKLLAHCDIQPQSNNTLSMNKPNPTTE